MLMILSYGSFATFKVPFTSSSLCNMPLFCLSQDTLMQVGLSLLMIASMLVVVESFLDPLSSHGAPRSKMLLPNQVLSLSYRTLSHIACELLWLCNLLIDLRVPLLYPSITWCDKVSVVALACNPVFHARTKHIEIDAHFIRDQVLSHQLVIQHVHYQDQLVDFLTILLPPLHFQVLCDKLGLRCSPMPRLRGLLQHDLFCSSTPSYCFFVSLYCYTLLVFDLTLHLLAVGNSIFCLI